MEKLFQKLKNYTIDDVLKIEESDRQFIAIKNLYKNINNKELFLFLIIANSLICYQLSWKWEDYWEEFSSYFSSRDLSENSLLVELWNFIKQSKNNKRFIDTKIKRLEKLDNFFSNFISREEYYYNNMLELRDLLSKNMWQKKDAKTIVFAVKMFSYWARNLYLFQVFPKEIFIPIDSRLQSLFDKYRWAYTDINKFYFDLSEKLKIPMLHLDALVWVNYDKFIND